MQAFALRKLAYILPFPLETSRYTLVAKALRCETAFSKEGHFMENLSSRKQGVFWELWRSVKVAVARFPALLALGIVTAVAMTLFTDPYPLCKINWPEEYMARLGYAGHWGMALSVLAQLLAERRHGRRAQLAAQAVIFVLSLAVAQLLFLPFDGEQSSMLCGGVTLALCAVIMFVLTRTQGSDIAFSNCITAAAIAGISALCVFVANLLLLLFLKFMAMMWENILILCYLGVSFIMLKIYLLIYVLFPMTFIALATREREQISQSFVNHYIVLGIFLPTGILFLVFLYMFLFQCLFAPAMPVREVYLYVSAATGGYLFFYFASLPYESPFLVFFRRYGALFMLPLLAVQIAAFTIKVNTEGYTPERVAALLYIIFSVASCALTFVRRGKYMGATFLIFAALCILRSAIMAMGNW